MSQENNEIFINHIVDQLLHSPDFILKVSDAARLREHIAQQVATLFNRLESKSISDRLCDSLTDAVLKKIAEITDGIARQAQVALLSNSPEGKISWSVYKGKSSVLSQRAYNAISKLGKLKYGRLAELTKFWPRDEQGNTNPTLAHLCQLSPYDILSITGAGLGTLNEIRKLLFSKGLSLHGDDRKIVIKV